VILVTACFPIESRWIARRPGVRVVRTAMGERSAAALDALGHRTSDATLLLATGFAGAVDPRIRRGELFLARAIRHGGEDIEIDQGLFDRACAALTDGRAGLHVGLCASIDDVADPPRKRALAADKVVAVDMESGPLARWAAGRGTPFLALRVVLDPAEAELPFLADRLAWLSALRHPVGAARMVFDAVHAARVLGPAVDAVVDAFFGGSDA